MIFLYILCAIILVFIIVLISHISITVSFEQENVNYTVKYLFKKILYNQNGIEGGLFSKKNNKKNVPKNELEVDEQPKKSKTEIVKIVCEMFQTIISELENFLGHVKVPKFVFKVNVGSSDAAKTAIKYGVICSLVYPVVSLMQTKMIFNKKNNELSVVSDFERNDTQLEVLAVFKIRLIFVLIYGLRIGLKYLKLKNKKEKV